MRLLVCLLASLVITLSYASLEALKNEDVYDEDEVVDGNQDGEGGVDGNQDGEGGVNGNHDEDDNIAKDSSDNLGKIRVSIGDGINIDTGSKGDIGTKTPLIIIAPVPIIDYERLYNKMKTNKKDSNIVTQEKLAMSDANSRLASLYSQLRDAESRLAFYKADKSQLELLRSEEA